jgi:nitrate/nitrite transporter NarK
MFGARSAGLVSGFGNFFANLGGFTFVYVLGAIKDATGSFQSGFAALSVACLVSLGATAWLRSLRSR